MGTFDLEKYLTGGVEKIIKGILKASVRNPETSLLVMQIAAGSKKAGELRHKAEKAGRHIPPFLIASITDKCNLHCKGCYARANHSCSDGAGNSASPVLDAGQWLDIFNQAAELGVAFILLAGGEPFVRRDILLAAAGQRKILFPVFTNGTMIDDAYLELLNTHRNLLPILSLEGGKETTDARRGKGVFDTLHRTMERMHNRGILFGASVTVHRDNMDEVMEEGFLNRLKESGCRGVIFVEYVPMDEDARKLAFRDADRERMMVRLNRLRTEENDMLFIAFPGDEKSSGGCLAAGRGFFHINAHGGAEPCPFSPFSDTSLLETPLEAALESPLFCRLRTEGVLMEEHIGGCVLHGQEDRVKELLGGEAV